METPATYNAAPPAPKPPSPIQALAPVAIGSQGIILQQFSEAARFAEMIWRSGMAPKDIDTPEKVLVVMQMGMEVGLPPMAALNGICVINGRPSIWGDNLPGLVTGKGVMEDMEEWYELNGVRLDRAPTKPSSGLSAVCMVKRRGRERPLVREFTWDMAVQAGLDKKSGPWQGYPLRMLAMRARAWAIRDQFPDVLRGCAVAEEAQDFGQPTLPAERPVESLHPPTPPASQPAAETPASGQPEPKLSPYEKSLAKKAARKAAKEAPPTVEAVVVPPAPKTLHEVREAMEAAEESPTGEARLLSPESRAKVEAAIEAKRNPRGQAQEPEPETFPPPPQRGSIPPQRAHAGGDVVPFALDPSPVDRKRHDDEPFI